MEPSKGVSCVAYRTFCSCSVACSIVLNVAVAFEQLYAGWFGYDACSLLLSQIVAIFLIISVACRGFETGLSPHFQTVSPVAQNPLGGGGHLYVL